jgi:hypothetical protein
MFAGSRTLTFYSSTRHYLEQNQSFGTRERAHRQAFKGRLNLLVFMPLRTNSSRRLAPLKFQLAQKTVRSIETNTEQNP